ncbi:MAG: DUF1540 domain-containing protein [Clostridia bacterium]|nr:DUF1540 domain-containing protein [Clostridia bacterium]
MKEYSHKIDCNVTKCCYNLNGQECTKNTISVVCCENNSCTACASFRDRCDD